MKKAVVEKSSRQIKVQVPEFTLDGKDFVFDVKTPSNWKIGTLKVSQGGVVWKGRGQVWRSNIPWETFDTVMKDYYNQKRFVPRKRKA